MTDSPRIRRIALRRPRLLIRAARLGVDRLPAQRASAPHLRGRPALPRRGAALHRLMDMEAELRCSAAAGAAGYSLSRHVEVLIAMMGEAQLLRAASCLPRRAVTAQTKASGIDAFLRAT